MAMKSLNIKIDEDLYETIRTIGFIKKKSMAVVVREFLRDTLASQPKELKDKVELVLEAEDEKRVLEILAQNEWVSQEDFDKEFRFDKKDFEK